MLAMLIAVCCAIPIGVFSATRKYTWVDFFSMCLALVGVSTPVFWLGLLLIFFFSYQLGWLPSSGRGGPIWTWSGMRHMILPAISLSTVMMASTARLMRSCMLEVLGREYITTAHAKGLRRTKVVWKHGVRNALIPVVTNIGLQIGVLLGGAVLTETIFALPGVGRLMVEAIMRRDYPVVQGIILLTVGIFAVINLIVDLVYVWLDPRIKLG